MRGKLVNAGAFLWRSSPWLLAACLAGAAWSAALMWGLLPPSSFPFEMLAAVALMASWPAQAGRGASGGTAIWLVLVLFGVPVGTLFLLFAALAMAIGWTSVVSPSAAPAVRDEYEPVPIGRAG